MTATPELFQETALKFRNSIHDLNEEIDEAVMLGGDLKFLHTRDDWDMKTLLIMLSECLVIMGVFMEAMGALVKLYGRRIRIASKHKAADATSVGSSLPVATASKVVSYPELPLTKATSPESNRQSPEAASPPPDPKRDRKPKPKFRSGRGKPQPPPTPAVPTPEKPPRRSKNSLPCPPLEPPAFQGGMKTQLCIAKENSQLSPPSESPAAEEEEGPPVTVKRRRPKKQAAEQEEGPPATAKRGRPKKQAAEQEEGPPATAKRGRPKKQAAEQEEGPPATAKRGRTKKQAAGEEEGRPVRRSTRHQT
ncbi:hypothetical protein BKA56DRAFT_681169 [Ilyonectria sp. MPI-CAGE-AT-0026]|nr:hypothetical protein BKA56DRAFT_681169 [Ilyonectria sp. MPI-CAGE-AT-0026]